MTLKQLLKSWKKISLDVLEINEKVKDLQSVLGFEDGQLKPNVDDISKRHSPWNPLNSEQVSKAISEKAVSLIDWLVRYTLAQEHGDLINLHDWFQPFKTVVLRPSTKRKHKSKQAPLPKKRKDTHESADKSEASIQARFCSAVTELQITGLIRMPSRRRPDCVQRVAFGLLTIAAIIEAYSALF